MHMSVVEPRQHETPSELDRFGAFLAAAAIEEHVVHFTDAGDLFVRDGNGFGPRIRRIIRVNPAVNIVNGTGSVLRGERFRMNQGNDRDHGKKQDRENRKEADCFH
jgi:hypothetical protein